jgi:bifunctional DNA-binding transcriptional regulator/antitoxin component of YhaV-PrlF toxin-antitoxin module
MAVKFVGKAKITKTGQVTLPNEARVNLSLNSSSEIFWYETNDFLIATKKLLSEEDVEKKLLRWK